MITLLSFPLAVIVVKVWQHTNRKQESVSDAWLTDQYRRECSSGVELPCISWESMRELARARGVIS